MDDIKDQDIDDDDKKVSTAETKKSKKEAKENKSGKTHSLATRRRGSRIADILHDLKNEISLRGQFQDYADDLRDSLDSRDELMNGDISAG